CQSERQPELDDLCVDGMDHESRGTQAACVRSLPSRCHMASSATRTLTSPADQINRCARELAAAKDKLSALSLAERRHLLEDCLERTIRLAHRWVEAACQAKGIPAGNPARAEEVAAGPVATARHLRLLIQNYRSVERSGRIELPAAPIETLDGTTGVQVMPVRGLFDSVAF